MMALLNSGFGDGFDAGLGVRTRLTCRDCGAVYDPALGDPARRVPPGTAFARLPERWACPGCDALPHRFGPADGGPVEPVEALTAGYRAVAAGEMRSLPLCNPALTVEPVGFRPCDDGLIGCMVAPWLLNAVVLPQDPARWADRRDGDAIELSLPSGTYRFNAARFGALGTLAMIPLASDMGLFAGQEDARAAARLGLDTLMDVPAPEPAPAATKPAAKPTLSRRALFGRRAG